MILDRMFLRSFLTLIFCLPAVLCSSVLLPATEPIAPWTTSLSENRAGSYRYTVNGWEDTSHWRQIGEEAEVRWIDSVHPMVLMLLIVFLASGLAVMASDDESVAQFWKESERR